MTIYFAPKAEADFAATIGYLAERNPTAAAELGYPRAALVVHIKEELGQAREQYGS